MHSYFPMVSPEELQHALHRLVAGTATPQDLALVQTALSSSGHPLTVGGDASHASIVLGNGNLTLNLTGVDAAEVRTLLTDLLRANGSPSLSPGSLPAPAAPAGLPTFRTNILALHRPLIGRDHLLRQIADHFTGSNASNLLVLHGVSGVGKSELAREYARRHHAGFPGGTFFLDATSGSLSIDLVTIGRRLLGIDPVEGLPLDDQAYRILHRVAATEALLILDNATSSDALQEWLPRHGSPCRVLLTSTLAFWPPGWATIEVLPLEEAATIDLTRQLAGDAVANRFGAELAQLSGGLPVQIVPAAIALGKQHQRGRLAQGKVTIEAEAMKSFRGPYERLDANARLLLHAASHLNLQRISRAELFLHLREGAGWDEDACDTALDACLDLHLLEGAEDLRLHALLAASLRDWAPDDPSLFAAVRRAQWDGFYALADTADNDPSDTEAVSAFASFPTSLSSWSDLADSLTSDGAFQISRAFAAVGQFEEALEWSRTAADAAQAQTGKPDHARVSSRLHHVGFCLSSLGHFAEAQPWYEQAAVEEERQGDVHCRVDHASLGTSLHCVGHCLSSLGRFAEAQPWYEQAADEGRQGDVHGRVDHTSVGTSLHQVGLCLSSLGRFAEAQPWYEQAVDVQRQGDVHGRVNHDSLGRSLHQVGFCLSSLGRFADALTSYEQAADEERQGDLYGRIDHAELGKSLHSVGYCLSSLGRFADAQPWFEQAVDAKRQGDVHGRVNHASLGTSLQQVGFCLSSRGCFADAESWYEQAVDEKRQGDVHGRVDHESVSTSIHALGISLARQGRRPEALRWYQRAIEESRQGDIHSRIDHASLAASLHAVAGCLLDADRPGEAIPHFEEAVAEARLGDKFGRIDHENLAFVLRTGAQCLRQLGHEARAHEWETEAASLLPAAPPRP